MDDFKKGLKFGFGFSLSCIVALVIVFGGLFLFEYIKESSKIETNSPEIAVKSVKHWVSDTNLIFTGYIENKSNHDWDLLSINFIVKDQAGGLYGRCNENLYSPKFKYGDIKIEAKCYDMPPNLENYSYTIELFGQY
jgi:hypothetical protein